MLSCGQRRGVSARAHADARHTDSQSHLLLQLVFEQIARQRRRAVGLAAKRARAICHAASAAQAHSAGGRSHALLRTMDAPEPRLRVFSIGL